MTLTQDAASQDLVDSPPVPKVVMSPEQCRMARAGLAITTRDLADSARVSISTITRFESGQSIPTMTVALFQRSLERLGISFVADGAKVGLWLTKPN